MATTVDEYIEQNPQWEDGLRELREILLDTGLKEEVKWGSPMYTLEGKNVVGLLGFKSYMGLWFHMGVFLEDSQKLLERSSDTTKSLRKMVFHSHEEFSKNKIHAREYILEAIENQKAGREMKVTRSRTLVIPDELQAALDGDSELMAAFGELTPGRQREYADYISEAKQVGTKLRRIEKIAGQILAGVGLHDRYK